MRSERHCALITEPDPELPLVEADQVQLQQVLLNLVVNAFEAMRETPAAERRVIIRSERESGRSRAGERARFWQPGCPWKSRERIFERFFSTKREGMGMGLAIARSIITSHGGELARRECPGRRRVCVFLAAGHRGRPGRMKSSAQIGGRASRHERTGTARLRGG